MIAAILAVIMVISVTCCTCCTAYAAETTVAETTVAETTDTAAEAEAEAIFERFEETQKISIFEVYDLIQIKNCVRYVANDDEVIYQEGKIILKGSFEVLATQNLTEKLEIIRKDKDSYLLLKKGDTKYLYIMRGEDHSYETGLLVLILGTIGGIGGLIMFGVAASDERKMLKRARISTIFGIVMSAVMVVWAISGLIILLII